MQYCNVDNLPGAVGIWVTDFLLAMTLCSIIIPSVMVCRVLLKTSALFRNFLEKIENHPDLWLVQNMTKICGRCPLFCGRWHFLKQKQNRTSFLPATWRWKSKGLLPNGSATEWLVGLKTFFKYFRTLISQVFLKVFQFEISWNSFPDKWMDDEWLVFSHHSVLTLKKKRKIIIPDY